MAEKVLVESIRQPGKVVRLSPRIAAHLVARGTHAYITRAVEPESAPSEKKAAPKKRTYKRRDMKAEE